MGRGAGAIQMTYGGPGTGGNQNYSVYTPTDSYDDGYAGGPTGQPVYDGTVYRPQGPGAAGQGSYSLQVDEIGDNIADSQFSGSGLAALTFLHPVLGLAATGYDLITSTGGEGATLSDRIANIPGWAFDKVTSMPIVQIGGSAFRGELFSDTLEWLGDVKDSPWNPANWESGEPPEWSVYLPDGDGQRLIASGTLGVNETSTSGSFQYTDEQLDELQETGRTTGVITSGGGTTNVTQEVLKPGDPGYIDYGPASGAPAPAPEGVEVPEGYIYDYTIGDLRKIQGNPYAYRIIDASNAYYNAGIDDLKISDEDWLNLSEEERQENFDARVDASQDFYNFGTESNSSSPFGTVRGLTAEEIQEGYFSGDITQTELLRHLDDIERSNEQNQANARERSVNILEQGGFTDEEIQQFLADNQAGLTSSVGVRSQEDYFNWYLNNTENLADTSNLQYATYDMYDAKRIADYDNYFTYLDLIRGTPEFEEYYLASDATKRNAYLGHSYLNGTLSAEDYQLGVVQNLVQSGESIFQLDDGRFALGTSKYEPYRILEFPDLEQGHLTQTEINRARAEGIDPFASYSLGDTEFLTSLPGASDEFNARRQRVSRLDNAGNVVFGAEQPGEPRPERPSAWVRFRDNVIRPAILDGLTNDLYSGAKATENIVKGEATSEDWLIFAPMALEATGYIQPPMSAEDANALADERTNEAIARGYSPSEAAEIGARARETALAGTGLDLGFFQLDYDQTIGLVRAATTGDIKAFAIDLATPYVESQLKDMLGDTATPQLVEQWQNTWDNMPSDVKTGLDKTMQEMLDGKSFDEAASQGVLAYLKESPFGRQIENTLKAAASSFDDNVLQPVKEIVEGLVDVESARAFLSNFDDKYLQPPKEEVQKATEPAVEEINKNLNEVGDEIDDTITAVEDAVPQGTTPEFGGDDDSFGTGTDVDVDIDLDLQAGRRRVFPGEQYEHSDLLKFATQVGVTPQEFIEYQDLLGSDPFGRTV